MLGWGYVVGAYVGEGTPIYVRTFEDAEEPEDVFTAALHEALAENPNVIEDVRAEALRSTVKVEGGTLHLTIPFIPRNTDGD